MSEKIKSEGNKLLPWILLAITVLILLFIILLSGSQKYRFPFLNEKLNNTTISHSLVVDKVEKVAKLISTETTLRDVVIYENTWYGSTKRSLVVVTGKLLAGIDLKDGHEVHIDHENRNIKITLPEAKILAIEVTELKTYDEQQGLWNPFRPDDRDSIFQLARSQFERTGQEMGISETAKKSAKELLESMFTIDGYSVEVDFRHPPLLRN
jgi:hypothetical protein